MYVNDILFKDLSSVSPDTNLKYLIKVMMRQRRDILPVVDEDNKYIGMVGVEEVIHAALPNYYQMLNSIAFMPDSNKLLDGLKKVRDKTVQEYIQSVPAVTENDTAVHAANLMIQKNLRSVAVVRDNKLVGVVNRVDFLSSLLEDRIDETLVGGY